jgi:hypothetical protein
VPPPRRPDPEPLEADEVTLITVGTALWAVALVVAFVLRDRLDDDGRGRWVWVAAAGVGLGLVGIRYVRRPRAAIRRASGPLDGDGGPSGT